MGHRNLTELAVQKRRRAHEERRNGARYGEALAESFAEPFEREAAELLKLAHPPKVGPGGEVVAPQVTSLPRKQGLAVETLNQGATRIAEDASIRRMDLLQQPSFDVLPLAIDAADSIGAANSLEKMLAHQLALAHEASIRLMDSALSFEHRHAGDQVETCRCASASARLMSVFQEGLLTLQRLRSGGNQTVTVQHVNVASGAQAVIGNVQTGGRTRRGSKPENE